MTSLTGPGGKETSAMTEQSQHALDRNDETSLRRQKASGPWSLAYLSDSPAIARAEALADSGQRRILGITGAPGSGKGTVEGGAKALGHQRSEYPWTDFTLPVPTGPPRPNRPQGSAADVRRCWVRGSAVPAAGPDGETVYAPGFHRGHRRVLRWGDCRPLIRSLVITEGNSPPPRPGPWSKALELLDQAWFVAPHEDQRIARLVERHILYGKTPEQAREWAPQRRTLRRAGIPHAPAPTSSSSAIPLRFSVEKNLRPSITSLASAPT